METMPFKNQKASSLDQQFINWNASQIRPLVNEDSKQVDGQLEAQTLEQEIKTISSANTGDSVQLGFYGHLGTGECWKELRNDLLFFLQDQKNLSSQKSFWAVFENQNFSNSGFEIALWKELTYLCTDEPTEKEASLQPTPKFCEPAFRISLGGFEMIVSGRHPECEEHHRQFSRPALVFQLMNGNSQAS